MGNKILQRRLRAIFFIENVSALEKSYLKNTICNTRSFTERVQSNKDVDICNKSQYQAYEDF